MAFAAGTIWHNWTTGGVNLGGGFDPTNVNFATDLTTDSNTANTSSPVVSSASHNFGAGDVDALLFVQGGTNWIPGWYPIVSVASNKATLGASIGSAVLYGTVVTEANYHRPNGLNTAAGCATVGTPTGGTWGIDYSQQTTAAISYTDMVIDGTTNTIYTSTGNPVGKNIIGNIINVTSGTGFTVQRVQVVSTSGTQATVDKSLGTLSSTGGNGALGGAIGSSSVVTALTQALVAGNQVYLKGTTTLTTTTTVTAAAKGDTTNGRIVVEGFTSYPGDNGKPTVTSETNSVHLFTMNDNDFFEWRNLTLTHSAATRGAAFTTVTNAATPLWFKNITVDGCSTMFNASTNIIIYYFESVEIKNTTSSSGSVNLGAAQLYFWGCDIHDNTGPGIRVTGGNGVVLDVQSTVIDTNSIGIESATTANTLALSMHGVTIVDNTGAGVKIAANSSAVTFDLRNNLFYSNGGYGIENLDDQAIADINARYNRNNAFGDNTSGAVTGIITGVNPITLTADPFVDRTGRDFGLNNTAGGGALLRSAAFPGAYPGGTTTSYLDVGAAQHQSTSGGGGKILASSIIEGLGQI